LVTMTELINTMEELNDVQTTGKKSEESRRKIDKLVDSNMSKIHIRRLKNGERT